jgi:hypothetical protein
MPNKRIALCKCGYLEDQAGDPDSPIRFDPEMNEYQFVHTTSEGVKVRMTIYHCPFCGGRAPETKRGNLFARLTGKETRRLTELTKPLRTLKQVLSSLGKPDRDNAVGMTVVTPERNGKPETTQNFRTLVYTNLSDSAEIHVTVYPMDRVAITFQGKYVGPASA